MVRSWETLTTLARGSPASPCRRRTLPGMAPSRRFDVTAATTVVEMVLREVRRGEELVEPPCDVCVTARPNRVPQDACHEPIPRLMALAGCAVHRSEEVIRHGDRGLTQGHWYSFR